MKKNITFFKIGILFLGLDCQSFVQLVNTNSTISCVFNLGVANQTLAYSSVIDSYFKPTSVTLTSNYINNGTSTPNSFSITADPSLTDVVFTNMKCVFV